jgi:chromosome segregation ATPase
LPCTLSFAEKELSQSKAQLQAATAERDSLLEDLRSVREAKRLADQAYRDQTQRVKSLEGELAFYRGQAAQAMADRDATAWECEELRKQNLALDARAREADGRAEASSAEQGAAERRAAAAEVRAAALESPAAEAAALPALRADLSAALASCNDLQRQHDALADRNRALARDLSASEAAQQTAAAAAAVAQAELQDVTQHKVEVLVRLSEAEAARAQAEGQLGSLTAALAASQGQLGQATQEKVAALLQVASLTATSQGEEPTRRSPQKSPRPASGQSTAPPASPDRWKLPWSGSPSKPKPPAEDG